GLALSGRAHGTVPQQSTFHVTPRSATAEVGRFHVKPPPPLAVDTTGDNRRFPRHHCLFAVDESGNRDELCSTPPGIPSGDDPLRGSLAWGVPGVGPVAGQPAAREIRIARTRG